MPLIQPAPHIRQGAPDVTLLTSALALPPEVRDYDRWRSGLGHRPVGGIEAQSRALCSVDSWDERGALADEAEFEPFTVSVVHGCEGRVDERTYRREAIEALGVKAAWQVARELWTGATTSNPSLQGSATDITGTASDPTATASYLLANFEDATSGGQGYLHVPSVAVAWLVSDQFVSRSGNRLLTPTGHVVVPGPGYPNVPGSWGPDGAAAAASGEVWMYVSGPVEVGLSETRVADGGRGTTMRRNLFEVYAAQEAIVRFDPDIVYGALATLTNT